MGSCFNLSREEGPLEGAGVIVATVTSFDRRQANTKYYVSSFFCVCVCVHVCRGGEEEGREEGREEEG